MALSSDVAPVQGQAPDLNIGTGMKSVTRCEALDGLNTDRKQLQQTLNEVVDKRLKDRLTESGLREDSAIDRRGDEIWRAHLRPEGLTAAQLQSMIDDANAIGHLIDQVTGTSTGEPPYSPAPQFRFTPERISRVQARYTAEMNSRYRNAVEDRVLGRIRILHLDDSPERAAIINDILEPYFSKKKLSGTEAKRLAGEVENLGKLADFLNRRGVKAEYISPDRALETAGTDPAQAQKKARGYYLSTASLTQEDIRKAQSWEFLPKGTKEITIEDAVRLGTPPEVKKSVQHMLGHARKSSVERCLGYVKAGIRKSGVRLDSLEDVGRAIDTVPMLAESCIRIRGVTKRNASLLPEGTLVVMKSSHQAGHIEMVCVSRGKVVGVSDHICRRGPAAYARGNVWAFSLYSA